MRGDSEWSPTNKDSQRAESGWCFRSRTDVEWVGGTSTQTGISQCWVLLSMSINKTNNDGGEYNVHILQTISYNSHRMQKKNISGGGGREGSNDDDDIFWIIKTFSQHIELPNSPHIFLSGHFTWHSCKIIISVGIHNLFEKRIENQIFEVVEQLKHKWTWRFEVKCLSSHPKCNDPCISCSPVYYCVREPIDEIAMTLGLLLPLFPPRSVHMTTL